MKRIFILLLCCLLAGCNLVEPVGPTSSQDAVSERSSGEASEQPQPSSGGEEASRPETSQSAGGPDAPMPEAPPAREVDAVELPEVLYSSAQGYGVELLTPAQYEIENPLNQEGSHGFLSGDYFKLRKGDKYALANQNGKLISDVEYDVEENWNDGGWETPSGGVPVQKDGQTGVVSATDGSVIVPLQPGDFAFAWAGGYYVLANGDNYTVFNAQGKQMYTYSRGDVFQPMGEAGGAVLLQNGMLRFYDKEGNPLKNFACEAIQEAFHNTQADGSARCVLLAVKVDGKWGLCDETGEFMAEPVYEEIGVAISDEDYVGVRKNGKMGVINYRGETVVKCEWDDLILSEKSASVCRDNKWGAITDLDSGKPSVEPGYDFIGRFDNGVASFERGGKYGLIDREGNEILSSRAQEIVLYSGANLEEGYYLVSGGEPGAYGIIDGEGHTIIPSDHRILTPASEDEPYNLIETPGGKWGYIDRTGQIVIDPQFEKAESFIPGKDVAMVKKDGKICLIDRKGNVVLQTEFTDCGAINNETLVCGMRYQNGAGEWKDCLVRLVLK